MKKLIIPVLILGMIFSLAGCGNKDNNTNNKDTKKEVQQETNEEKAQKTEIENTINKFFSDVKDCNINGAESYLVDNDYKDIDKLHYASLTDGEKKAVRYWNEKINYKINSVTLTNKSAEVIMDILSIDSDKVYSNYMNNLLTLKMKILSTKDEEIKKKYNEQYNEALINSIKNKDNKMIKSTVTLGMENKDGKWYIIGNNDLLSALYGGFDFQKFQLK